MTDLAVVLLGLMTGIIIGYNYRIVKDELAELRETKADKDTEEQPGVTRQEPNEIVWLNQKEDSAIIEPKSPQLIEWELEQDELAKARMGKPK